MKMKKIRIYLLAALATAFVFTACDEEEKLIKELEDQNPIPELPPLTGDPGPIDFSTYIALGNSITAGFQDNALYNQGQQLSFPALLAQQFQIEGLGGGDFGQPDINSDIGYSGPGEDGIPGTSDDLGRFVLNLDIPAPEPLPGGEIFGPFTGDKATIRNFGVPGMRVVDVNDASLAARNPLWARFANQPGASTVLGDALATTPTFFTYWLGNNDILGWAVGGGSNDALITPTGDFQTALTESLGALTQSGAQGTVNTLPLIITIPFFNAVPFNAIPLEDANQVAQLNGAFAGVNAAVNAAAGNNVITPEEAAARQVVYNVSASNPILIFDDELTDLGPFWDVAIPDPVQRAQLEPYRQARPATADDRPLLTAATVLGTLVGGNPQAINGVTIPVEDQFILTGSEAQTLVGTRAAYNSIIAGVVDGINTAAGAPVLTLVDVQPDFADIAGLDPQTAAGLVDPSLIPGSGFPQLPFLRDMANAAAQRADGQQGILIEGFNLAPDFSPNGIYSVDGVHPNPRGAAIIANRIIESLNADKGTQIPLIQVLALRGIISK